MSRTKHECKKISLIFILSHFSINIIRAYLFFYLRAKVWGGFSNIFYTHIKKYQDTEIVRYLLSSNKIPLLKCSKLSRNNKNIPMPF